jgi:hypothetical protein
MAKTRKVSRKSSRRAGRRAGRRGTRRSGGIVSQTKHHIVRVLKVLTKTANKAIKFGKGLGKTVLKKTSSVVRNITKKGRRKD